ncbi:hypothetical protein HETIRDRAFT_415457 [Heterobasidion irregulare TC 32-1]|uniref:F-box domain-containing protein n=1 Tax=Heterobasidion irregulare (strain TC 32-1) TaxID=747525 RepID=W4KEF2_HETIT|nr:uncharacterized protein HETIRDRAFT_415457 [Heterobasidion irregulare TC 32-1]ETW83700.1 hypothetical protein HETIRDRAFT_415457 [Heterobasidion irregulare TC 32-1]
MTFIQETATQKAIRNQAVLDAIFSYSSPGTILRMSRTCRRIKDLVDSYIRAAFNINRHLSRYFPDPIAFRSMQARTASLLSGSNALQFLDRTTYPDTDLDLYVFQECTGEVGRFMLENGYRFLPTEMQDADFEIALIQRTVMNTVYPGPLRGVFQFVKKSDNGEDLKVEVISTTAPFSCVLCSYSTCVMNMISYEKAYSLFPRATFEDRTSFICTNVPWRRDVAIKKYTQRGWDVLRSRRAYVIRDDLLSVERRLDDAYTWTMPLNVEGIPPVSLSPSSSSLKSDPVSICCWRSIGQQSDSRTWDQLTRIDNGLLSLLKFRYIIQDATLARHIAGLLHCIASHRAANLNRYYDAELIQFCQEYYRRCKEIRSA